MSKTVLLAGLAGVLSACTITINGSGSEGNTSSQNTSGPFTTAGTSDDPVTSTTPTSEPVTTSEQAPTTDVPTTGSSTSEPVATGSSGTGSTADTDTTAGSEGTASEGSSTADTTTGASGYGLCGWNVAKTYYACTTDDGVAGLADPKGNYAIDCPDQELAVGAACGGVGAAGCCLPTGDLYYCADAMLVLENCGA